MSLKKQLEFYFSNQNYHKDTFLRTTCEEGQGIPIKTILTFKRLRGPNYTEEDVKNALQDNKIIQVNGDKLMKVVDKNYEEYITRNHDDYIIVIDDIDDSLTFEEIESVLEKYFVPKLIRMKRNSKKKFMGAVMVELESLEEVERVLKLELPVFGKKETNEKTGEKAKTDEKAKIDEKTKSDENEKADEENKENTDEDTIETRKSELKEIKNKESEPVEDNEEKTEDDKTRKAELKKSTKKKSKKENVKKVKASFLSIYTKAEFQKTNKSKGHKVDKQGIFFEKNKNKLYKFMTEKTFSIKEIKEIVKDVAFVDLEKMVLRFKNVPEKESQTINEDMKISRLDEKEYKEYVNRLNFGESKKK